MSNAKLKSISAQNYRCFHGEKEFHAEFGETTRVSGRNGSGKSTVMNIFLETLTGKNADGTQPDNVRPVVDGKELEGVDVIRSIVINVNGTDREICKITKQKKAGKTATGDPKYIAGSNENNYTLDGISTPQKRLEEFIEENICKPKFLIYCCNANAFFSIKSTTDRRAFLEDVVGFDLQAYIKSLGVEFTEVETITKGHPIEQVQKTLNKQLSDQKKKTEQAETTWKYEKSREPEKGEAEIAELQKSVDEYSKQIAGLDEQGKALNDVSSAYDEKSREIVELRNKQSKIRTERNSVLSGNRQTVQSEIADLQSQKKGKSNELSLAEMDLKHANMGIERHSAELVKAQADWKEYSSREYPEEHLEAIKAEVFDENSLICPTCGQDLPEEQADKIRAEFEQKKAKRIKDEEGVRAAFYEAKDKKLTEITESENKAATDLKEAKKAKEEAEQKIAETKKSISDLALMIAEKEKELSALPAEVDLSGDAEYNAISTQIEAAQKSLEAMDNGSSARAEITEKRDTYIRESAKLAAEINKIQSDRKRHEKQVEKLYEDYRESSQLEADIQRKKDVLKNFSIKKNERIAEMINPYFSEFQFNFLSYTQNNDPVEVCEILSGGIEYKDMNHSKKILVQADLIRGFQKIQGVSLPIFIDDTESVNDENLPKFEGQTVLLKVADTDLKVEQL